jgi:DNA-binding transcriptional LysR family regulator
MWPKSACPCQIGGVDIDLAQVRAFAAVAELRHFGKAAAKLHLTQQALSKRIQRLEQLLGEPLLMRNSGAVELTEAGERFLPHAWTLLTVAETAVADARSASRPLRVDVWGHMHLPLRWVRRLTGTESRLAVEVSMRRSFSAAIDALVRGEIDAAFGRVHDLSRPVPDELDHQPVGLDRVGALISLRHPLAQAGAVCVADLTGGIWAPSGHGAPELTGAYRRLADDFGIPLIVDGANLGIEHAAQQAGDHPTRAVIAPVDLPIPPDAGVRMVPLTDPVPYWLWSIAWRRDDRNPALALLLRRLRDLGRAEGWLAFDQATDWLPEPDLAGLSRAFDRPTPPRASGTRPSTAPRPAR